MSHSGCTCFPIHLYSVKMEVTRAVQCGAASFQAFFKKTFPVSLDAAVTIIYKVAVINNCVEENM